MRAFNSKFYEILEWVTRAAFLHILWILFSLMGGIILGIYPSTVSLFAIIRDWLRGKTEDPILKTFWQNYKKEFWKSNRLGAFLSCFIFLIAIDVLYLQSSHSFTWIHLPLFSFILLFLLFTFYLFPVYVHFDMPVRQLIKNAFLIMLIHPIHTFLLMICLGSVVTVFYFFPAICFIFGGSVYAFCCMWICLNLFTKLTGT